MRSTSAPASFIPGCVATRDIVSLEQTDIRSLDPSRLAEPPDFITIDVSFISLKHVLPAACALAGRPAHLLALVKPQFEAPRRAIRKGIVRDEAVHHAVVAEIADLAPRSAAAISSTFPHRSPGPTATASFSSGRAVVERLTIDHLGNRGDGVALQDAGPLYVPYTLPGETVEADDWPGHPDRRQLLRVEVPSAERIAPICPHFGVCGGCALQHWEPRPTAPGNATRGGRSCARPVSPPMSPI